MVTLGVKRIRAKEDLRIIFLPESTLPNTHTHTLVHNQRTEKEKEFIENYIQLAQPLPQVAIWAGPSHTPGSILATDGGGLG